MMRADDNKQTQETGYRDNERVLSVWEKKMDDAL